MKENLKNQDDKVSAATEPVAGYLFLSTFVIL